MNKKYIFSVLVLGLCIALHGSWGSVPGLEKDLIEKTGKWSKKGFKYLLDKTLIDAASNGYLGVVKALIVAGADVNCQDIYRLSALMFAAVYGHLDVVKVLIAAGADVNCQDKNGETVLMWAVVGGHLDVVKALIAAGANVNLRMSGGVTALMMAASRGYLEIVKILIAAGADVMLQDKYGKTALDRAKPDEIIVLTDFERESVDQVRLFLEKEMNRIHQEELALFSDLTQQRLARQEAKGKRRGNLDTKPQGFFTKEVGSFLTFPEQPTTPAAV